VGNVVSLNKSWLDGFKEEAKMFDNGIYDDQIDAGADAFNELSTGSFFSDCDMQEDAPDE